MILIDTLNDSKDHLLKEPTQISLILQICATLEVSNYFATLKVTTLCAPHSYPVPNSRKSFQH